MCFSITSARTYYLTKTLQNFERVSWAGCLLKATPALYDNEMGETIFHLGLDGLFAGAEQCRIFLGNRLRRGVVGSESSRLRNEKGFAQKLSFAHWNRCDNHTTGCCCRLDLARTAVVSQRSVSFRPYYECWLLRFYKQLLAVSWRTDCCSFWHVVVDLLSGVRCMVNRCRWDNLAVCCYCEAGAVQLSHIHTHARNYGNIDLLGKCYQMLITHYSLVVAQRSLKVTLPSFLNVSSEELRFK